MWLLARRALSTRLRVSPPWSQRRRERTPRELKRGQVHAITASAAPLVQGHGQQTRYTEMPMVSTAAYPFFVSPVSVAISYCVPSAKTLSPPFVVEFWPCDAYTPVRYTADDTLSGNAICVVFARVPLTKT